MESNKDLKFRSLFDLIGAQYGYVTGYQGPPICLERSNAEIDYVVKNMPGAGDIMLQNELVPGCWA